MLYQLVQEKHKPRKKIIALLFVTAGMGCIPATAQPSVCADLIKVSAFAAGGYLVGRGCAAFYHYQVKKEYQEEFNLLNSSLYEPGSKELRDQLCNIILSKHNRAYGWFSNPGHYPFMRYKGRLDSFIIRLSIFRYFYFDAATRADIDVMRSCLEEIREYLVQDYRYIQEHRQFFAQLSE